MNFYAYCNNNGINANDPSGEVALIDNAAGALIAGGVNLAAQYTQAKLTGRSFGFSNINWTRTAVATGFGFATSGVSALLGAGVGGLELGAMTSFGLRTGGNVLIGASANVAQTAALNNWEGTNNSLGTAALWGGAFGGAGSVVADAFPAISSASTQARINALSPGEYNLWSNFADLNGLKLGGPSPTWTAVGTQFGNAVSSSTAFVPGDAGTSNATTAAAGGFLIYPNKPNNNLSINVYSKLPGY